MILQYLLLLKQEVFELLECLHFVLCSGLDAEMEKEIDDLRRRYNAKRQPILDAMDQKRKRQQNF